MLRIKRLFFQFAAISLLGFTTTHFCYAGVNTILAADNQVAIHYVSTDVDYGETGNGVLGTSTGLLDTEKGAVPGFGIDISLMGNKLISNGYLRIGISSVKGHTNYVGALIGGGPYGSVVSTSTATITDFNLRLGKGFSLGSNFIFTPFLEVGDHQWDRGVNLGELYKHDYYAAGALAQTSVAHSLVLSVNGMIGNTFNSSIDVNGYPFGFSTSLGNSMIWRVGASADYAISGHFHVDAGIDYTRFKYGISALIPVPGLPGAYMWEPDSSTKYTTVKAGIGYAF